MNTFQSIKINNPGTKVFLKPITISLITVFVLILYALSREHFMLFIDRVVLDIVFISIVFIISFFVSSRLIYKRKVYYENIQKEMEKNRKIDEENKYNHSLLEAALESTADGILVVDNFGRTSKANKKFAKLWNIPDDLIHSNDDDKMLTYVLNQLKDPVQFLDKVKELYSNPSGESLDLVHFKDGRVFERYSMPHRLDNEIIGRVWSFYDITAHVQVKDSLHRERILLRTVIDNIPDAIYAKDLALNKTLANPADLYNMGLTREEEAIGKGDYDVFSKEEADVFAADDRRVLSGQEILNREETFIDKRGKKCWLLTTKLPMRTEDGKIIGLVGIGRDISKRKKSELIRQALLEISEAAYTVVDMYALFKRIHEVISSLITVKNIYIALYDEMTELLSFPYFIDEFDPPQPPKKLGSGLTEYVLRTGKASLIDSKKDLELREKGEVSLIGAPAAIWLGVPLKIGTKTIGIIVVQDYENVHAYGEDEMQLLIFVSEQIAQVIERKRNSDAVKKYAEELKQLNITKDKFFSIIAHDLKNPFITIMGFSDLLLSDFTELSQDEKLYYIKEMKKSADLSHHLLQNLLQWSRSQTGRIEYKPDNLHLSNIVDEILMLLNQTAAKKQIHFEKYIREDAYIFADQDMIETVLRNLLTNAIKFSHEGGAIIIDARPVEKFMEISVSDTGVGMNQKTLDNLFKLEATHSTLGTNNESGTGLGLILCKEFIEKHNGTIRAENREEGGSRFVFTVPLKDESRV